MTTSIFCAHSTFMVSPSNNARDININSMSKEIKKVFLYGEFQTSVPQFTKEIWSMVNEQLKGVPGLVRKTWLLGIGTNTVGGFYEFDSVQNARTFATGLYAEQAKYLGASLTVKIFDGDATEEASRAMNSPHYN